ncbi:MAG TPA: HNH endonuclease [Puia sp.]|nr:HNH endonuclease [Puia sp.]
MGVKKTVSDYRDDIDFLIHQDPLEETEYYLVGLFAEDDGKCYYHVETHWVGFADGPKRNEIREASLVDPGFIINEFKEMKRPVFVIHSAAQLAFFTCVIGGHALIEKKLARRLLKRILEPKAMVQTYDKGFVHIGSIPKGKLNYAPSRKLRRKILDRDKQCCRICGASPATNKHVELNLHHIRPYGKGGLTEEENLITLCRICHKGLHPHKDFSLYASIGVRRALERELSESYVRSLNRNIDVLSKEED